MYPYSAPEPAIAKVKSILCAEDTRAVGSEHLRW